MLALRVPLPAALAKIGGVLSGEVGRLLLLGKVEEKVEYDGEEGE